VNHRFRARRRRQQGVTAYCVIVTVALLAILSHNVVNQALVGYAQGAQTRDTIVVQQLTDSARAQALYHLNRNDRAAAMAPIREAFGVAQIEISEGKQDRTLRIAASAPNAQRPRSMSRVLFHLARDTKGRWIVVSAVREPIPLGE